MAAQSVRTETKPQLIPTNAGFRTWAAPPEALQQEVVPNDLFYIRNHWANCPEIDINTYRLVVDGEVENPLSLSFDEVLGMAQQRFQVTFECCGNSPGARLLGQGHPHRLGYGDDQGPRHHGQRRVGRYFSERPAGPSRSKRLGGGGYV